MRVSRVSQVFVYLIALVAVGCSSGPQPTTELHHFALDDLRGVIEESIIQLDQQISADGNGSIKITAENPTVVRLFELDDINLENARLLYRAQVRTEDIQGRVYLEMLCHFPGLGEYFSRDLASPLTGSVDWSLEEIPFFLQCGQNPDTVKLNLVIEGTGTAWIDDIHLLQAPLNM